MYSLVWLPVYLSQQLALLSQHANNIYILCRGECCPPPTSHDISPVRSVEESVASPHTAL